MYTKIMKKTVQLRKIFQKKEKIKKSISNKAQMMYNIYLSKFNIYRER